MAAIANAATGRCTFPERSSIPYSHVDVLNPRLFAFSATARLIWSEAPFGKLALISTVILISARGSATRLLIISSASWTRRIFAVAGLTSTEP